MALNMLHVDVTRFLDRLRDHGVPADALISLRASIEDAIARAPLPVPTSSAPTLPETPRSRGSSQRMPAVRFPLDEDDGDE